jgi:ketosteroid isomerase-like protein
VPGANVELHRLADEAFNTRDAEAYIAFCHPEIELHSGVAGAGGGVYHGHGGVRRWHGDIKDAFGDDIRLEPEHYFEAGEHTVSFHTLRGRGRRSGAPVVQPAAHLCRWRDGLIAYFKGYQHREEVFRDLGVRADELEPIAP